MHARVRQRVAQAVSSVPLKGASEGNEYDERRKGHRWKSLFSRAKIMQIHRYFRAHFQSDRKSIPLACGFLLMCGIFIRFVVGQLGLIATSAPQHRSILFAYRSNEPHKPSPPWHDSLIFVQRSINPRRNGIFFRALTASEFNEGRTISQIAYVLECQNKQSWIVWMDKQTPFYDSREKNLGRYVHWDEDDYPKESGCYRPKWSYDVHPECNSFHEIDLARLPQKGRKDYAASYISYGFFRETFLLEEPILGDEIVMKSLRLHEKRWVNAFTMETVQMEALVMSATSGSELIMDFYGHCGTSVLVERGYGIRNRVLPVEELVSQDRVKFQEDKAGGDVVPRNFFLTPEIKLKVAYKMALSLAVLHGYKRGIIVNDDVQIEQWLLNKDGLLRLNDFNNAVVKTYNPERKEYCMFKKSFAYVYRSPEENNYELTDERSDVYALGQIYYTLLTGLVPFYDSKDWDVPLERIIKGDTPFIDERYTNRSLIEKRLVQLMYPMWERQPQNRVEIFSVIKHLEKTIHFYEQSNPNVHILDVDLTLLAEKSSGYPKLSNTTHQ